MMKIRPQIMVAILCATVFSMFAAWLAYKMDAVEVMTAIIGGVFGLLGGVSLRIIDNEPPEGE
jgi:ribulose 1,5-bisphosphate carboxylase large subunit-like protein